MIVTPPAWRQLSETLNSQGRRVLWRTGCWLAVILLYISMLAEAARAELPTGYLVWSKGTQGDSSTRKIYRMTLPAKGDVVALTSGEDVGCQISPDGKWVAYAKAKLEGGSDYHAFQLWKVYLVSIEGMGSGAQEIEIDPDGYWPSWGNDNTLYYSKADDTHTRIIRVALDGAGQVSASQEVLSTRQAFPSIPEINECFVAPDGSWFAGRTRGTPSVVGVGAYSIDPPKWHLLGKTGGAGCMPYVAPSGTWGFHAGSSDGIRWGDAPQINNRQENQQLIPPLADGYLCYHPGISTDGQWVMTGQSKSSDQNAGAWDLYLYKLDPVSMTISAGQELATSGFNGWPHLWIGGSSPPPPLNDGGAVVPKSDTGSPLDMAPADARIGEDLGARPVAVLQGGCTLISAGAALGDLPLPIALVLALIVFGVLANLLQKVKYS